MKKYSNFTTRILAGIIVLTLSYAFVIIPLNIFENPLKLKNKEYYSEIFDKKDQKVLNKVYKGYEKGDKLIEKQNAYYEKIDKYYGYLSLPITEKKKKKYTKKMTKFEKKSDKLGLKAMIVFQKANAQAKGIYDKNLKKYSPDSTNAKLLQILDKKANNLFDTAKIIRQNAENLELKDKYNKYKQADNLEVYALSLQEKMFFIYMKDEAEIEKIKDEYCPKKEEPEVVEVQQKNIKKYQPENDPNLYFSKLDQIAKLAKFENNELMVVSKIKNEGTKSSFFTQKSDSLFTLVQNIREEASKKDFIERKGMLSEANSKQSEAEYYQMQAIKNNIETNKTHFSLLIRNVEKSRTADSTEIYKNGIANEKLAEKFFTEARKIEQKADGMSDKNKKLQNYFIANDLMLTAIQYEENAYANYLGFDETEVISFYSFQAEEPVIAKTDNSENQTTENNKNSKDKTVADNTKKDNQKTSNQKTESKTKKTKSEYESTWTYSIANPTPAKLATIQGVVFRVQVATVKNPLSPTKFARFMPVVYDKFTNSSLERYMVGEYRTSDAAELALIEVKSMGYSDAMIVGYVNGKRTSYGYAKSKMNKPTNYNELVKQEKAVILGDDCNLTETKTVATTTTDTKKNNQPSKTTKSGDITKTKYLVYVVQIGTFSTQKTSNQLNGISPLYHAKTSNGKYRYFAGLYYSLDDAKKQNERIRKLGFSDAYVTAFNNGEEITVSRASQIESNVKKTSQAQFKVQIGAYTSDLSAQELNEKFGKIQQKYTISKQTISTLKVYTVGSYSTYEDAVKLNTEIKNMGYDCFVIAIKGGNKIPINQARK